mgnify:CR=1 FL=1
MSRDILLTNKQSSNLRMLHSSFVCSSPSHLDISPFWVPRNSCPCPQMEDNNLVAVIADGDFSDDDEWDTQETNEPARSFGDETENGDKSQDETSYEEGIQRAWKSGGDLQTHSSIPFPMRRYCLQPSDCFLVTQTILKLFRFMSAEPSLIELNLTMIHNTTLPDTGPLPFFLSPLWNHA